ncbi:MAG: glycosyltransferase involved in cell wall biosynthesis [Planctomycetota bacterium]|jgi:glycosyltransferase involved in cell wall biosynthesis
MPPTDPRAPRVLLSALALAQPMGGVRRQAAELFPRVARLLQAAGGRLDVLASKHGLPADLAGRLPGDVRVISSPAAAGGPLARALSEPRALQASIDAAKRAGEPYDLVHTGHMPVPSIDVPFTLMLHDLRDLDASLTPLLRRKIAERLLPKTLGRAAGILTVSNTMVHDLAERFPDVKHRVRLVPHGSDHLTLARRTQGARAGDDSNQSGPSATGEANFKQAPSQPNAGTLGFETAGDEDAPILYLGHLEPRKNVELLLEAVALDPSLPRLLIVGRPKSNEGRRLARLAKKLDIKERVHFQGPVDERHLPELLATAGCMVLPSRLEGFGIPVLEAHRAGLPLAIARTAALVEAAAPGTPCFSADEPEECARALHGALNQSSTQILDAQLFAAKSTWDLGAAALFEAWTEAASPWIRD